MEAKEFQAELKDLATSLEGKSKEQVENAITAFQVKNKEVIDNQVKEVKGEFEAKLKEVQDHANSLDVKLKAKEQSTKSVDKVKAIIVDGYENIKNVVKSGKVYIESKAVGNMTLGASLTGDQPRTFSNEVATIPDQILNFSDLVGVINIGNGTYTFPRRTTSEGAAATQTEGADKGQLDYDLSMIDVNTDFIAGFCVYSRKMANNLPFLESFLPGELRRSYFDGENSVFNTALAAAATASTQIITGKNKIEMLMNEVATLAGSNWSTDGILVSPADYNSILQTEVSTGAGYGLPGVVTLVNGRLAINGIPLFQANFMAANKYYVGNWATIKKVVTEGLSLQFSTEDEDNFRKNNITARIEAQVGLAIHRPDAIIYGDFTAI
jgi:HK97 family phage major capsid protein